MPYSEFKTENLALASFLALNGLGYKIELSENKRGIFKFMPVSDSESSQLDDLTTTFHEGAARVEPTRFVKTVASVRGDLYLFLDDARSNTKEPAG